ncbi:DUF4333 domain-containing protein [Nocardioides pacificus]
MTRKPTALAVVTLLALTGCSGEVSVGSTPKVSESSLEQTVLERMTDYAGVAPDEVECPDGLEGEEGKTQRCVLHAGEDRVGVTVTVTSAEGDTVNFDIEADDEVMP